MIYLFQSPFLHNVWITLGTHLGYLSDSGDLKMSKILKNSKLINASFFLLANYMTCFLKYISITF